MVASDERTSAVGKFLENLGWYDPKTKGSNYKLDLDRISYWQENGARMTATVASMIKKAKQAAPAVEEIPESEMEPAELAEETVSTEADAVAEEAETPSPAAEEPSSDEDK